MNFIPSTLRQLLVATATFSLVATTMACDGGVVAHHDDHAEATEQPSQDHAGIEASDSGAAEPSEPGHSEDTDGVTDRLVTTAMDAHPAPNAMETGVFVAPAGVEATETTDEGAGADEPAEDTGSDPVPSTLEPLITTIPLSDTVALVLDNPSDVTADDDIYSYQGNITVQLANSIAMLPGVDVDFTLDADGNLATLQGTIGGLPQADEGFLGMLGGMNIAGPASLTIGYDFADASFDADGILPLDAETKYLHVVADAGLQAKWGPLKVAAPNSGSLTVALDHTDPAFFAFTNFKVFGSLLNSAAFGFSAKKNIAFSPTTDVEVHGQGAKLPEFNGQMFAYGSKDILWNSDLDWAGKFKGGVTVGGGMTLDVDEAKFAAGDITAIRNLGINGTLNLKLQAGTVSLNMDMAQGSAALLNDGRFLSFSGVADTDGLTNWLNLGELLHIDGQAKVVGNIGLGSQQETFGSFVEMEADLVVANLLTIDAKLKASAFGLTFSGTSSFVGQHLNVTGSVAGDSVKLSTKVKVGPKSITLSGKADDNGFKLSGSVKASETFDFYAGEVTGKAEVKASISSSGTLKTTVKLKGCIDAIGFIDECVSVSGSIKVTSSSLEVCGKLPYVGQQCIEL